MFSVLIGLLSAASSDYTYGRRVHEVHLPEIYADTRSPAGRTLLSEIVGFGRPRREHGVQEVGAAAQHAAGRVRPRFGHRAPADQVLAATWNEKRAAGRLAAGRRRVAERVVMGWVVLHVVQHGDAAHRGPKRGMRRHVGHALVAEPDFAAVLQPLDVCCTGACAHAALEGISGCCGGALYGVPRKRASLTRESIELASESC